MPETGTAAGASMTAFFRSRLASTLISSQPSVPRLSEIFIRPQVLHLESYIASLHLLDELSNARDAQPLTAACFGRTWRVRDGRGASSQLQTPA